MYDASTFSSMKPGKKAKIEKETPKGGEHTVARLQDFSTSCPEEITIVIPSLSGGSLKQKLTFDSSTGNVAHRTAFTLAQFARCVRAFIPLTSITLRLTRGAYSRINCSCY